MTKTIYCLRLKADGHALDKAPFPGPLGEKILNNISKQGWSEWLGHQTMLINEYRLSMIDPKAREFLKEEMQKFLFEANSDKPAGYQPTDEESTKPE